MKPVTLKIAPENLSEGMVGGWQLRRERDYTGGETLATLPEAIKRNQLILAQNCMLSHEGWLSDCFQVDTPSLTSVGNGIVFSRAKTDGTYTAWYYLPTDPAGHIRSFPYDPASVNDLTTGTDHDTTTAVPLPDFAGLKYAVRYLAKDYAPGKNGGIINLTDYLVITGGALTGKTVVKLRAYDNRLWGICSDGSIIFSNNGDATTWDALNIILLPNQEPCIDFLPVQGGVILTHQTGAYALYGSGTYQDTSILPIQSSAVNPPIFTDSAVLVGNVVYILGNRGIVEISLNGIQEVPHFQEPYFSANYPAWNSAPGSVQAVYLYKFHAILFLFPTTYSTQGIMFYLANNAIFKLNLSLPTGFPYMIEMNDAGIDFLIASSSTSVCKSVYPSGNLVFNRGISFQTRHEDFDSLRDKVFGEIKAYMATIVYNVSITAYVDYGTGIIVADSVNLAPGENLIPIDGFKLRGKTISFRFDINAIVNILVDEANGNYVKDENGKYMTDENSVGETNISSFALKELAVRYYETGPEI